MTVTVCDFEDYTLSQDGEWDGPFWCRLPDGHDGPHQTTPIQCVVVNLDTRSDTP